MGIWIMTTHSIRMRIQRINRFTRIILIIIAGMVFIGPASELIVPNAQHAFAQSAEGQNAIDPAKQWSQWRGPMGTGVAPHGDPPIEWSEQHNVRWKVDVPGHGLSAPIIWGDRIYLQTAIPVNPKSEEEGDQPEARTRPLRKRIDGMDGRGGRRNRDAQRNRDGQRDRNTRRDRSDDGRRERGVEGRRNRDPDLNREGQRDRGDRGGERRARRRDGREGRGGPAGQEGRGMRGRRGGRGRRSAPTESYKFTVLAYDRGTGELLWQRTVREAVPHEGNHRDGSLAPASPITDGKHIYAHFGSRGLYCLTMDGDVVWEKDLGDMKTRNGFGEGSSPALHGNTLVVNWDHEGDSFIVALDKTTGQEKWRRDRNEVTSWSTPLILEDRGLTQVVVSAADRVRSYDLKTGETIWECGGLGVNCAPTPVAGSGLVFAMSGYRDPALLAIRYRDARGDLTDSDAVAWQLDKGTSYVPSPLLYKDSLYFLQKSSGILSCYDPKTGKPHFTQQRLEDIKGVYASPVGASDRVYIAGRNGVTYVLKRGPSFQVLGVNKLDDGFSASPAIVGDTIYLRGRDHLYSIASD